MQRDLEVLHAAWISLHPGLYRYQTPAELETRFAAARFRCSRPMDERRFFIQLAQLAEAIHCGHTYPNPLNLPDSVAKRILPETVVPFLFQVAAGNKLIITHNLSPDKNILPGDEIESINGIRVNTLIDSLMTVSRSDGRNGTNRKLNNIDQTPGEIDTHTFFDLYYPFFFGESKDFLIGINPLKGKDYCRAMPGLTIAERKATYKAKFGPVPVDEGTFSYKLLDPETAYIAAGTFAFWNSKFPIEKYIDSIFVDLNNKTAVKGLVIDIRANEGGNDELANQILAYLAPKPFGCQDQARITFRGLSVPDTLRPYLSTWDKSFFEAKDPALYRLNEAGLYEQKAAAKPCEPLNPQPKRFTGKVVMLIGPKNSSATFEMAEMFKAHNMGTLVGEPTGGTQQGLNGGKMFFLHLPGSHFELDLPIQHYYHPGKPDEGIQPEHLVTVSRADIAKGEDPQLDFAVKHLKKNFLGLKKQ
jgi:hypothetical protein